MALTEQTIQIDAYTNPLAVIEVGDDGDGDMHHGLDFREDMRFSSEYFTWGDNYQDMFSLADDEVRDEHGDWLTPRAETLLARRVNELLPDDFDAYTYCDTSEYPHIVISVTYNGDRELTDDNIEDVYWDAYATLMNITDPGTFNSPYVFADVMRELSSE